MVILENTETGELRKAGNSGSFRKPWRVKEFIPDDPAKAAEVSVKQKRDAKLAVWGTKFGLPVPQLLDAARWLLKKDCSYCQLGTQVLRRMEELGEERTRELVAQILAAKEANDESVLIRMRKELNG